MALQSAPMNARAFTGSLFIKLQAQSCAASFLYGHGPRQELVPH